ncbi:eukaryotic translation initiation factor 4 gamma 2 isoform X2 [Centruroides vittatus]|uniref:eukaryotic translation initiation factor 4 gamma 2 isoform X2 n=1 Tax=Centruroides vittatus TaxID=120091 RepID=UPI00350F2909
MNITSPGATHQLGHKTFDSILLVVLVILNVTTDGQRGLGGASRCSGGRDEPPRPITTSVGSAIRRWVPPSSIKRDAITPEEKNDLVFRKVRGILNKLTPEKFHKLSEELLSIGLDSTQILKGVILLIFDKALDEPKYSSMYAQLCHKLCEEAPNFDFPSNSSSSHSSNNNNSSNTFRRLLLAKCQDEFENRRKTSEAFDKKDGPLSAEEEEQRAVAKHKMLGNIKFIGELGKQGLLQETILHQCVHQLLLKKKRQSLKDMAEDLECLCQIMKTVGHRLDTEKAKARMDQYFDRMKTLANNNELPSRIRFMLQDVLELRQNKWIPRRVLSDHGPKTIQQVREEAARDYGVYIPPPAFSSRNMPVPSSGMLAGKMRGGMDDVFSHLPIGVGLGTGPGVIPTDNFPAYSSNMGRPNRSGGLSNTGFLTTGGTGSFYGQNRNKPIQNRDRDLFPNYQQQRQTPAQNQHMHGFSGSPTINRDVPPRFLKKALQQQTGNLDEISLRPAQNSILLKSKPMAGSFAKPVVSSIPLVSGSAGTDTSVIRDFSSGAIIPNVVPNSLQKEVVVKQSTQDKNKANKQGPSKEEVMKKAENFLSDYLNHQNADNAVNAYKDMKVPKKFLADVIIMFMLKTLEKSESDRECISRLLAMLKKDGVLHNNVFLEAMKAVFQQMSDLEAEVPRVKSYVAGFSARGIADNIVLLGEIAEPLEGGAHYPLFLLCLQQLHKTQGRTWLDTTFNQSKINLLSMLPEMDRTKERLADILEDRGLGFLFPLLRIQADLWKQIQSDKSPNSLYRWIKENVDVTQHSVPGFVNALVSCLIKFITQETTLAEGIDYAAVPDKTLTDKEKELLMKFKPVFLAFLQEHPDLQLITLYALQVHCYNNSFPKGMMLRWFISFYELEIVEEEAFLKWKEDVNDEYPGKGKALFQVNQWLTWLEEAEEEEGSDEGDN